MKRLLKDDRGVAIAFLVIVFAGLLALSAIVIDMGSWYTQKRKLQATADAAVLAGAQDLPNTAVATASAHTYANANNSGLNAWNPTFPNTSTIEVSLAKPAPAFFAKVFGIETVTVHARASANVGVPGSIYSALPIAVKESIVCAAASVGCFGVQKTLTFDNTTTESFGSSTWGLLDLSGSSTSGSTCNGTVGESSQSSWVTQGYPGLLGVNRYYGASTGQRTSIQNALNGRIGQVLLVPVYDQSDDDWCTTGGFRIIGWAAFVIDRSISNSEWNPHNKTLHGHFVEYIAHDVDSTPGVPGFGVKVIKLTG
jgi:hypothetical protein